MGKIFNKGLDKDDQKEGLFKRLRNIEDKNEEQLKLFSNANKTSSHTKMKVIIIMTITNLLLTSVTETQNFKVRSLQSKYNDISKFYEALNEFKNHRTNTDETQQHKNRVINNAVALHNNYFDSYKKNFNENFDETPNETFDETTLDEIKILTSLK